MVSSSDVRRYNGSGQIKRAPEQVTTVQVIPDTIDVNGDSLSFRGRTEGQVFQVFYKLASQEEQTYFQELTDLVQLEVDAEVSLTSRST